jgi:hypothetical protein
MGFAKVSRASQRGVGVRWFGLCGGGGGLEIIEMR